MKKYIIELSEDYDNAMKCDIKHRTPSKVHIEHVLDIEKYTDKLIVYRVYGKHKQYWHYFSCYDFEMDMYVEHCQ